MCQMIILKAASPWTVFTSSYTFYFKYVNYTVCTKGQAEILLNRIKNNEQKLKSKKLVMWNCSTNNTMSYLLDSLTELQTRSENVKFV